MGVLTGVLGLVIVVAVAVAAYRRWIGDSDSPDWVTHDEWEWHED